MKIDHFFDRILSLEFPASHGELTVGQNSRRRTDHRSARHDRRSARHLMYGQPYKFNLRRFVKIVVDFPNSTLNYENTPPLKLKIDAYF